MCTAIYHFIHNVLCQVLLPFGGVLDLHWRSLYRESKEVIFTTVSSRQVELQYTSIPAIHSAVASTPRTLQTVTPCPEACLRDWDLQANIRYRVITKSSISMATTHSLTITPMQGSSDMSFCLTASWYFRCESMSDCEGLGSETGWL